MDQQNPQPMFNSNITPIFVNMLELNLGLLNNTNQILDTWSRKVSNLGNFNNDGVKRLEIMTNKNTDSVTNSRKSFSHYNKNSDSKHSDLDLNTQLSNLTNNEEIDYNPVSNINISKQENTVIKKEQDREIKKEPLLDNNKSEEIFENNEIDLAKNDLVAEVENSCTNCIKLHVKEEAVDGINNQTNAVEEITNEISKGFKAVKNELECGKDITSCDDLLIPHCVRSCSSIDADSDQFGPTSSKKSRTRSNGSLTTNNMVKINYGIRDKLRKNVPKKKLTDRAWNKTDHYTSTSVQKYTEIFEPVLSCNQCSYRTWNKNYMDLHTRMHENEGDGGITFCHICDYVALDKHILIKHLIEHNGKSPFRCTACEFKSNIPSGLIKHSKIHHSNITRPFTCNICEYKSANNSDVIRHTRTHTGVKPFACKQCPYRSTDSSSLTFHMRSHTGEKPYSCKLCDYRTKSNSGLISHMRTHTGEKPFMCKACEHRFANHSDLVRHMKINVTEKLLNCDLCGFNSTARCALVKHLKTHTHLDVFKCVLCEYKCSRNDYLLKHMRAHNGVNAYACDSCSFKCDTYMKFMKHQHTHTYGGMLTCEICSYVCVGRQVLVMHMRTHGEVSYSCTECDFKCLRKCDLMEHRGLHADETAFACAHCKYKCRSSKTLAKHVTETHVGKNEVEYII